MRVAEPGGDHTTAVARRAVSKWKAAVLQSRTRNHNEQRLAGEKGTLQLLHSGRSGHEIGSSISYGLAANSISGKSAIRTPDDVMAARAARERAARMRANHEHTPISAASLDVTMLDNMTSATASFGSAKTAAGAAAAARSHSEFMQHVGEAFIEKPAARGQGAWPPLTTRKSFTASPIELGASEASEPVTYSQNSRPEEVTLAAIAQGDDGIVSSPEDLDDSLFALPRRSVRYAKPTSHRQRPSLGMRPVQDAQSTTGHEAYSGSYLHSSDLQQRASGGLPRTRSQGRAPAPIVNVYNDATQDADLRANPVYPPSPNSHGHRTSSRLADEMLADELAELGPDRRLRSRSRGSSESSRLHHSTRLRDEIDEQSPGQPFDRTRSSDSSGTIEGPIRKSRSKDSDQEVRNTPSPPGPAARKQPPPVKATTTDASSGRGAQFAPPPPVERMLRPPAPRALTMYAVPTSSRRHSMAAATPAAQAESRETGAFAATNGAAALLRRWLVTKPEVQQEADT
ncbi:hypothetical protein B0A48_18347 [Cryoendolithus antarcticus]|uniref:Uncharacterized protein n=1 Tax=Cryoendolithus antarcticus TaxID=1507870 RepID=A0A1V8SB74_9PEZI|nr:hypothetical protein B0A48_18347 [Cryoendolithus antarcticus]